MSDDEKIATVTPIGEAKKARKRKPATTVTEIDLADRFLAVDDGNFRHCGALQGWLAYDGTRWAIDRLEAVREAVKASAQRVLEESAALHDDALFRVGVKAASSRGVDAVLKTARSDRRVAVGAEIFDADPYLLNVANGAVDLRTGTLRPHNRADLITRLAPAAFDARARAPRFDSFLAEILPDPEVRAFLQRWAGYAATAVIREHVLPVACGVGANGKSALFKILSSVLGDYSLAMPPGFLAEKRGDEHPTEIARLRGVRLAVSSETRNGCALDEQKTKELCGGDELAGRFMRGDFFTFKPTAKFVLLTNHKPRLRGTDHGIRRRVVLVPFDVVIAEKRQDGKLGETIVATEAPGVLRWIVEGAAAWYARGEKLEAPAAVRVATADYHAAEDVFARFLDECCELRPADERPVRVRCKPAELLAAFVAWCEATGERSAGTQRSVSERLAAMGYTAEKSHGTRWYSGIGLTSGVAGVATFVPGSGARAGSGNGSGDPRDPRGFLDEHDAYDDDLFNREEP